MNILFYQRGLSPIGGGVERVTYNISKELRRRGFNIYVSYWYKERKDSVIFDSCYAKMVCVPLVSKSAICKLLDFVIENKIDVIINQCAENINITKSLYCIKKRVNIKLYSFLHLCPTSSRDGSHYSDFRFPSLVLRSFVKRFMLFFFQYDKRRLRFAYKFSDKLVLLSARFKNDVISLIGTESMNDMDDKLCFIPNCCSFVNVYNPKNLDRKQKILLVVCRMVENNKRVLFSIDLWHDIYKLYPDWKMIIVGDGAQLNDYKKIVEKYKLKNISFTGKIDPLPLYEASSIFLMTSRFEGFGMTLLEAQQMGVVPVAIDSYKSLHDIVIDGYNGLTVRNEILDDFVSCVRNLMDDENLRKRLASNAIYSSRKFSSSVIVERWIELLK